MLAQALIAGGDAQKMTAYTAQTKCENISHVKRMCTQMLGKKQLEIVLQCFEPKTTEKFGTSVSLKFKK